MSDAIKNFITTNAKAIGFDAVGFAPADLPPEVAENLAGYIEGGNHGEMDWLAEKAAWRGNPKAMWAEAKSVIMLGHNYAPAENPLKKLGRKTIGNISCYALNDDYHDVIKKKLKQLAGLIATKYGCEVKVFVDTAPVMEKPLAAMAGLGWQGKHTCLVSREFGNWLFLGAIFTTLDFSSHPVDGVAVAQDLVNTAKDPVQSLRASQDDGYCGTCTRCLDICSTNAFIAPRQIDARKCISYLTIESKEQIPLEYRKAIGNRIYGCDDCLAICPWNSFAKTAQEAKYQARDELKNPLLKDLVVLDDASFRELFRKSPVKRIGRDRFVRNVLVAIGNSEDTSLIPTIQPLTHDNSALVADMAAWAVGELMQLSQSPPCQA